MNKLRTMAVACGLWVLSGEPGLAREPRQLIERQDATWGELPAPVRDALTLEAHGGNVYELERDYWTDNSTTYDAEIVQGSEATYVRVRSDGTLTERHDHAPREKK